MSYFLAFCILLIRCHAREQYPWSGSDELDEDVDRLLKQGLKIGYQPKTATNGEGLVVFCMSRSIIMPFRDQSFGL